MPSPRPIRRQSVRSAGAPCERRGYQASGTEIVRPSLRSTVNVSSVTATFVAAGTAISISEEVIPCLQELVLMVAEDLLDRRRSTRPKSPLMRQGERLQPELCHAVLAFDMNVSWLAAITSVKEYAIRT